MTGTEMGGRVVMARATPVPMRPDQEEMPVPARPAMADWLLSTAVGLGILLALSLFGWWLWRDWGFLVWLGSDRTFCL